MSDFVTRLAERAMGTVPIVQPLIAPRFARGPADHLIEHEDEPAEVPDLTPPRTRPDTPTPDEQEPQNEESDTGVTLPYSAPDDRTRPDPSDASTTGQEGVDVPDTSGPPRRPPAAREPGPLETGMESIQEERQISSSTPPRPLARAPESGSRTLLSGEQARQVFPDRGLRREYRTTIADGRNPPPELRLESEPRVESAPARRGFEEAPPRLVAEGPTLDPFAPDDVTGRAMPLAERARVTVEAPALTSGAAPVIVPRIVRHQPDQWREDSADEARVIAPKSPAPTIKVTIGRIEVRAVTPQAPVQRETPARPGPLLSLDDYLTQRNGGHR